MNYDPGNRVDLWPAQTLEVERLKKRVEELERKRVCHICQEPCETCCSDCAIDLGSRVYVHGNKSECMDKHEVACPAKLKAKLQSARELVSKFHKYYTGYCDEISLSDLLREAREFLEKLK